MELTTSPEQAKRREPEQRAADSGTSPERHPTTITRRTDEVKPNGACCVAP